MIGLIQITPPAVEPVTLSMAKQFASVDPTFNGDDALLTGLIVAARQLAESYCRRSFYNQTWQQSLDRFPMWWGNSEIKNITDTSQFPWTYFFNGLTIQLMLPRVVSVTSIKYLDNTGTVQTLDSNTYLVDVDSEPCRITPANNCYWPQDTYATYSPGNVKIKYVTGTYGDGTSIDTCPQTVKTAIAILVSHWYVNREASAEVPQAFYSLLDSQRFMTFSYNLY